MQPELKKAIKRVAELRMEIEKRLPCNNCGARAGQPCKHDYGCITEDRLPKGAQ